MLRLFGVSEGAHGGTLHIERPNAVFQYDDGSIREIGEYFVTRYLQRPSAN